jgi:CheY-like chemotaxis protein
MVPLTALGNLGEAVRLAATKTLLVLEDDPSVMRVLRMMLEQYTLVEATTAEQALGLFAEHGRQVDLLITHLTLPTSSGLQVALFFRSTTPDLPVILTTGYPISAWRDRDSADVEQLGSRSVAVLPKPFQVQTLWKAVRELLAPVAGVSGEG